MHENLFFVLHGNMEVTLADQSHIRVNKGEFVGEGSFLGEPHSSRPSVDALPGCRYIRWNLEKIKALAAKDAPSRRALEVKIGRELAHKLKGTSDRLSLAEHQLTVMKLCFNTNKGSVDDALRKVFNSHVDRCGTITWKQFQAMMLDLDDSLTTMKIRQLFDAVDTDANGKIGINEFLKWMKKNDVDNSKCTIWYG
eukprot:gnl/TRDRNA2_/TRDRNA2_145485_c1_seq1.p1 gnl/TRDRNA2_/TRDRNA2_145485_c1~~gnl/TRDRNA2_/TRDRNA2_145485_c1_seq1.p1  ORF type:complete len:207 (-),score=36.45 gnl/TRDRNA2_/TRDRNA2_145485_c1_seq1:259-846(-)